METPFHVKIKKCITSIVNSGLLYHNGDTMKRLLITLLLCVTGMAVFAQSTDMSYYTEEYSRLGATFSDRLKVLEAVRDANLTGIGEFYHNALKILLTKIPDVKTRAEWEANEASARIICQKLADEKYTEAAPDIWPLVIHYDVANDANNGLAMQEALVAMGQVDGKAFVPNIALCLDALNVKETSDAESRRRIQRAVAGAINALEALHDIGGYKPVFFASVGWFDPSIRTIAYEALPNIVDDPGEVISEIILQSSNNPEIKIAAWQEILRTNAPDTSKAKVAASALAAGWAYQTNEPYFQRVLREMRISAIDGIRLLGVEDDSVYANMEKSYSNNFITNMPHYDEMRKTTEALSVIKSDEAVKLLLKFLQELNGRRQNGPWGNKERLALQMVVPAIGATNTKSEEVRQLLTSIQRSPDYTGAEQGWARDALRELQ
jgi:hypothetical protein